MTLEQAFDQALIKYADRFKENFPVMMMRGTPEVEIIDLINTALDSGIPYELPPDDSPFPLLY